jgi:hypothetical protein
MNIGDIVKLKSDNHLSELLPGNFIIREVREFGILMHKRTRYHIISMDGKGSMTWVYDEEVEMVSNLRDQKLEKLGIK